MKHKLKITFLILSFSGCQLLSKDKLMLKKLHQKEELQIVEQRQMQSEQNKLVLIDSSYNDFTITIWPKGKFTFNMASGFEGEADKVLIKEMHTQLKALKIKTEKRQDSTSIKVNSTSQKEQHMLVEKSKFKINPTWTWLLLLPLFYVIYYVYKK